MGGVGGMGGAVKVDRSADAVPEKPQPPPPVHSLLTLDQVDVSPPELHGAQPLLAVVPQSPQVAAGAPPQLPPAAQLPGLSETLRSDNNTRCDTLPLCNAAGSVGMPQRCRPYLSLRFSAMGLASSRMGLTSVWLRCLPSFFLKVFPLHFQLPDELSGDLGFLRLEPTEDDFLR